MASVDQQEIDLDSVIDRLLEGECSRTHTHSEQRLARPGAVSVPPKADHRPRDTSCCRRPFPVRGNRPGKQVQLAENEIRYLCTKARDIFINQPILLELEAPIKICGAFSIATNKPGLSTLNTFSFGSLTQATFTDNITTCSDCSSTAASPRKRTTSSWVTM